VKCYLEWNAALAAHFFRPELAGEQVHLHVDEDLISELGKPSGSGITEFVSATKAGPPWGTRQGICQKALQALEGWRDRELAYPPYIGYLCLFVLAAGLEGDFAPHAYYPRLRKLLDYPEGGELPSFPRMLDLWDDLERWATHDCGGKLGIFVARVVGGHIHVGLPLGQTILTVQERKALPRIFSRAGLDPTSPPPDAELARVLRAGGPGLLRARTVNLLQNRGDQDLYEILIDTVSEELASWDGQVEEAEIGRGEARAAVHGTLRLCLRLDPVAGRVQASLRCRLNREFPEAQLLLARSEDRQEFRCEEELPGWSTPLQDSEANRPADASQFDWAAGVALREDRLGWQFRLPGTSIRILVKGESEGLPGLVEVHELPRSLPFFLLFQDSCWQRLRAWIEEDGAGFREHAIREGLPRGWRLASMREARSDARVREAFPALSFPQRVRIRLRSGIRSSAGNSYFAFAPPAVAVEGGDGQEEVWCSEQLLSVSAGTNLYRLPAALPADRRISIEIRRDGRVLGRCSLYLTGDFAWRRSRPVREFDRWGNPAGPSTPAPRVAGATVEDGNLDTSRFRLHPLLAPGLGSSRSRRTFFVGQRPGEIVSWPAQALPTDWDAVWAIPMARHGRAVYCGSSPDRAASLPRGQLPARDRVELWKEILWRRRKRIAPPQHPRLRALWKQFQEAARDA
jgi:hypothetical protein